MATKMCFFVDLSNVFREKTVNFNYIKGMAFSQKQKNVLSFHSSIKNECPNLNILEISTKSNIPLGVLLSAFNLKIDGFFVESLFQSSKVFSDGTQYDFLKNYSPIEAKKYISTEAKGNLKCFRYQNIDFPLIPRSLFYDYIYTKALAQIPEISKELKNYDIFTDIEFNEKKQINCQARSCAIYSYMLRTNSVDYHLSSVQAFQELYNKNIDAVQISFFD